MEQTAQEISLIIDDKERELSKLLKDNQAIEQEKLLLQRAILEQQMKKKDLEIALSKSGHSIRQVSIEIKLLKNKFWSVKS